jgi:hypothetical protein
MIRVVHHGSRIRIMTFNPSRIQGSKRHWIPDTESATLIESLIKCTGTEETALYTKCTEKMYLAESMCKGFATCKEGKIITLTTNLSNII